MLFLVEGTDGAGKSTFVEQLATKLRRDYPDDEVSIRACGPPLRHPLDEYETPLRDYRPGRGQHIIYDRHFLGEWIYPQIFNRTSRGDRATLTHIQLFLRARGALLMHVDPGDEIIARRIESRGDSMVTQAQALVAAERFRLLTRERVHLPLWCTTAMGDDVVRTAISLAHYHDAQARHLNAFRTYIGPPTPRYLLLSDVRHHLRFDITSAAALADHSPAFAPYVGTSGHYLLSHLPDAMLGHVGIANACDVDDARALWYALGRPVTLALGANAARVVPWAVDRVHHPQYVRRFVHATGSQYGANIMSKLNATPGSELM